MTDYTILKKIIQLHSQDINKLSQKEISHRINLTRSYKSKIPEMVKELSDNTNEFFSKKYLVHKSLIPKIMKVLNIKKSEAYKYKKFIINHNQTLPSRVNNIENNLL